ncbi:MAG: transcription termination/antitermination protein NusG [Candidatus Omnitrophica bacterium]|nr:transcription termination/antitermination protein NusG [Candidatus Omnitrophota bacterium]MCM8816262.1 transcription termination/antitermination protein NusG [Candidatus Omnitrophota bacterium]
MSKWFIVHVRTGQEDKIKKLIEARLSNAGNTKIKQIIIPTENIVENIKGNKKVRPKRFFPGYLLLEAEDEVDDITWHLIKSTNGVLNVLGAGTRPAPLQNKEIDNLLQEIEERKTKPVPKIEFNKGDKVVITDGPFVNFNGLVEDVNSEKERLKVSVSIFGRSTILELNFWQVEKV